MNEAFQNICIAAGAAVVTHLSIVDNAGAQIGNRRPVSWTAPSGGMVRPTDDLVFEVPAGTSVAGWRAHSAASGGTAYGGANFAPVAFSNAGDFTLQADLTAIDIDSV